MTTKNIEFNVKLNSEEVTRQISELQQKLSSIQTGSNYMAKASSVYGEGSPMSKDSQRIFQTQQAEDLKYLKEKHNNLQRLKDNQEKLYKINESALGKEKIADDEKTKILAEQVKLRERMMAIQKEQIEIAERAKIADPNLSGFKGAGDPTTPTTPTTSPTGGGSGAGSSSFESILNMIGKGAAVKMIADAISGTARYTAEAVFEYEQTKSREQAQVTSGMYQATGMADIMHGKGVGLAYNNPERMRAMENAQEALTGLDIREWGKNIGASVLGGAGIATSMGVLGGTIATGGMLPAAIGAAAITTAMFTGEAGAYLKGANPFNKDTGAAALERYRAMNFAENFQNNIEAEKARDPFKQRAFEYFEGNRDRFIQTEQIAGINDKGLLDYLQGGEYTQAQKLGMMGGIAGAGGSSAQIRHANQALRLQRNYGIQNAAGIMGSLSGNIGGGGTGADSVTKRILADAFSVGLDSSKFSRETEKFLQMSASFVEASGARAPEAMSKMDQRMGDFSIGTSMADINAAGGARERYNQITGGGGTALGQALGYTKMRSTFKGLSPYQMTYLNNMSADQIMAGGPVIEAAAHDAGMRLEDFQSSMMEVHKDKVSPIAEIRKARKNLEETRKELKGETNLQKREELRQSIKLQEGRLIPMDFGVGTTKDTDQYKGLSLVEATTGGGVMRDLTKPAPAQQQGVFTDAQKADATAEGKMLGELRKYEKEYASSAKTMANISGELAIALSSLTDAIKSNDEKLKTTAAQSVINAMSGKGNVKPSSQGAAR